MSTYLCRRLSFNDKHTESKGSKYSWHPSCLADKVRTDALVPLNGCPRSGELAVPDEHGRSVFASIMKRRKHVCYYAFDLLWPNGKDLRGLPLVARKQALKHILSTSSPRVHVDHLRGNGTQLYRLACRLDLEGIVAKKADSPYEDGAIHTGLKSKTPNYSQKEGRSDLFKRAG